MMPDERNEYSCDWENCATDLDQNLWIFTVGEERFLALDPTPDGDASDAFFVYQYANDESEADANGIDVENWFTWKFNGEASPLNFQVNQFSTSIPLASASDSSFAY